MQIILHLCFLDQQIKLHNVTESRDNTAHGTAASLENSFMLYNIQHKNAKVHMCIVIAETKTKLIDLNSLISPIFQSLKSFLIIMYTVAYLVHRV